MEILLKVLVVVSILSLISFAVAIWYLVLRITKTLESIDKNIKRMADDMERVLKNADSITEKIDNILTPIEKITKITPILGLVIRFFPFFKKGKK